MTAALYKVLGRGGEPIHGGTGPWHLPNNGKPGKWMPTTKTVECCARGYHLVELYALPQWLLADCAIFEAEGRGATVTDGTGKTAFAQARLLRQVHISDRGLRLFAADCAEHVLPIFLQARPDDDRPANAIEAARSFARGEIDDAARDAAWAAAGAAAGDAARTAAMAAADAAARAAAGDAARDAARAAAGVAAGAAAWVAAWDAAWAVAGAAERDAAWDAAWDAARAAERQWQAGRLTTYLTEQPT